MTENTAEQGRIIDASGQELALEDLPRDEFELVRRITEWEVQFGPLTPADAVIDPEKFRPTLLDYLKGIVRPSVAPTVDFACSGVLGGISYWVFDCRLTEETPLYLMVVRDDDISEVVCWEQSVNYFDEEKQVQYDLLLTPEQAALYEFLVGTLRNRPDEGG